MPVTLEVESLGGLGDGIASWENLPVFIPKTLPGERVLVRIAEKTRHEARAEPVEILKSSPERRDAPCAHFAECGGCALQHLQHETYRDFKWKRAQDALRLAGFETTPLPPLVCMPAAARRRVEFKLAHGEAGTSLAFVGARSHRRVAVSSCAVLSPALAENMRAWPNFLHALPGREQLLSLQLTEVENGIDAALEARHLSPAQMDALRRQPLPGGVIRLSLHSGHGFRTVQQLKTPRLTLGQTEVEVPPGAFLQASAEAQARLTREVGEAVAGARRVADLFAGLGAYAFALPEPAETLAVESDVRMVQAMQTAARKNPRVTPAQRDLFASPLSARSLAAFDAVILNPPRAGARAQCEQLAASDVKKIVMISCNPATFARDAKILRESGRRLERALALDQFTWSAHVEMVGVFARS